MNVKHNKNSNKNRSDSRYSAAATRWLTLCILPLVGYFIDAFADCPSPQPPSVFSDDVREFYADACRESGAPLVLASDTSVRSRLQLPSGGHRLTEDDIYPEKARRLSFEGSVVAAFVVELDGTVHHSKIMQSSGHRSLDDAVWMYWKQYKFDAPGQFDGIPARTIVLERMNFKLKGGSGLPPSFSDRVVDNLGLRIIRPYTRSDGSALYQDLDETAKGTTSPDDIQRRLAGYAKQFGAMRYVEYKGLVGVINVGGVPHYKLGYLVGTAMPQAGSAVLIVTAVDRMPLPGIIGFEFQRSNIRLTFP